MPEVSVIIPAFNASEFIAEAVDSVLAQSFKDFEVLIVNDGSTDHTLDVLRDYQSKVTIINQENQGVSTARNNGINIARGKYLVFLDADDIFMPNKLEDQSDFLDMHPNICAVFSNLCAFTISKNGKKTSWPYHVNKTLVKRIGPPSKNAPIFMVQNILPPVAAMVRKACAHKIGGFDTDLSGLADRDFWYRMGCQYELAFIEEKTAHYRIHSQNMSGDKSHMLSDYKKLLCKLHTSEHFLTSSNLRKSHYLMHHGLSFLLYEEIELAKEQLREAVQLFPLNPLTLGIYFALITLGSRAVNFIHLKRKLFG
jgi:glycosyltransferase involved in cell wall biosynthesis